MVTFCTSPSENQEGLGRRDGIAAGLELAGLGMAEREACQVTTQPENKRDIETAACVSIQCTGTGSTFMSHRFVHISSGMNLRVLSSHAKKF